MTTKTTAARSPTIAHLLPSVDILLIAGLFIATFLVAEASASKDIPLNENNRIKNAYCPIPTYHSTLFKGPARAFLRDGNEPLILVNNNYTNNVGLKEFFVAHECCHHKLNHLDRTKLGIMALNGRTVARKLAKMEADADCCAAKLLTYHHNTRAIEVAKRFMMRYGRVPTGFGYPTGAARFGTIKSCQERALKEFAGQFQSKSPK